MLVWGKEPPAASAPCSTVGLGAALGRWKLSYQMLGLSYLIRPPPSPHQSGVFHLRNLHYRPYQQYGVPMVSPYFSLPRHGAYPDHTTWLVRHLITTNGAPAKNVSDVD